MSSGIRKLPLTLILLLLAAAGGLTIYNLAQQLPPAQWARALSAPDIDDVRQMLFHYSLLPRLTVSLLAGAGLGLVGVLFQQVLRNPLAEPSTLGVAAGAQLGLTIATLWVLPGGEFTRQLAAMVGAIVVGGLVFGVAWGKRMSPVTLILAGLVLGLYCGAVNSLLALFNYDQLQGMFLWGTGALNQQDWSAVQFLLPRLLVAGLLAALLLRPLTLLGLDDGVARNLGLGLSMARFCALGVAIIFSAMLVSAVGVIGFIGLFAPLMAKMLGARRLAHRMMLAPLLGALLLWLTDQVMLGVTQVWHEIPTGAATALFGAPLLLWLLPRLRSAATPPPMNLGDKVPAERGNLPGWILVGGLVLLIGLALALMLGKNAGGWHWSLGVELDALLPWRWPRVLSALAAGMMLAVAGTLIQKLTGNPMASPEVLGISSGAAFGVVMMLFMVPGDAFVWLLPAGSLGAAATLLIIMIAAGRGGFSTERMLLAGIALSTAFTTVIFLLLASGDPRMGGLADLALRFDLFGGAGAGAAHRADRRRIAGIGAAVPPLADHPAARRRHRPFCGHCADAGAVEHSVAGCHPDRDGDLDRRAAELCRADGAAYGAHAGLPPRAAANGDRRAAGRLADGVCRLVRTDAAVPVSDPRRVIGDLYRCTVLRVSVA